MPLVYVTIVDDHDDMIVEEASVDYSTRSKGMDIPVSEVSDNELLDSMFSLMGNFSELRRRLRLKDEKISGLEDEVDHLKQRVLELSDQQKA